MGDFYELFFDDAVVASRALGITLTKRGRHLGDDIPMCGVPVHAADDYLQKLIALGHRVAVCEQTEDPADARQRQVGRPPRCDAARYARHDHRGPAARFRPQQLSRGAGADGRAATAATGTRLPGSTSRPASSASSNARPAGCLAALARIEPREVLVVDRLADDPEVRSLMSGLGAALTPLPAAFFDAGHAESELAELFGVKTMESFGNFSARRAFRRRGADRLCRQDTGREAPADRATEATQRRRRDADRRRDARQSGAVSLDFGGGAGTLFCGDRPDTRAPPGRGFSPSGWRARSPIRPRSTGGSTGWSSSSNGRSCASVSARRLRACLTCSARCRGSGSTAAARATST